MKLQIAACSSALVCAFMAGTRDVGEETLIQFTFADTFLSPITASKSWNLGNCSMRPSQPGLVGTGKMARKMAPQRVWYFGEAWY